MFVRDHDDRRATLVEIEQHPHDALARLAVQGTGRLVREQQRRFTRDRARDRRALLLAAGQLLRPVAQPLPEPDPPQRRFGALAALAQPDSGVQQAIGDVVQGGHAWRQVKQLEDEADPPRPQRRELTVGEPGDGEPVDDDIARARAVERAHHVQHRRLARARRPHDRHQLPAVDIEIDLAERRHPARVFAADPAQHQDRLGRTTHFGTPTLTPAAMPLPLTSTCPAANMPVCTGTIRVLAPSTTSTPKPPCGSASSAVTGTASTPLRLLLTKSTSTGAASSGPRAFWSGIVTVTVTVPALRGDGRADSCDRPSHRALAGNSDRDRATLDGERAVGHLELDVDQPSGARVAEHR